VQVILLLILQVVNIIAVELVTGIRRYILFTLSQLSKRRLSVIENTDLLTLILLCLVDQGHLAHIAAIVQIAPWLDPIVPLDLLQDFLFTFVFFLGGHRPATPATACTATDGLLLTTGPHD